MNEWTENDDNTLIDMWGKHLPASRIGVVLGKSKSAVIGRARRLGLEKRAPTNLAGVMGKIEANRASRREPIGCRYIHGHPSDEDWYYCQKPGEPWCEEHKKIVFMKINEDVHVRHCWGVLSIGFISR